MADSNITTRALTYRDPTVSAAAEVQLRRNRQRSLDALVDQAEQTSSSAERVAQLDRNREDSFRTAKNAADQQTDDSNAAAQQQTDETSTALTSFAGNLRQALQGNQQDTEESGRAEAGQPTVAFTAQQIAQEQLGGGLHVPPLQPADEAYRRAGAEPPLVTEQASPTVLAVAV
jgi:hypothetical protein